jgi:hypothetical protein
MTKGELEMDGSEVGRWCVVGGFTVVREVQKKLGE